MNNIHKIKLIDLGLHTTQRLMEIFFTKINQIIVNQNKIIDLLGKYESKNSSNSKSN